MLKADIRHYFDEVDHNVLVRIIQKRIKDKKILWLINRILDNYFTIPGKGMPLGNLTSQFFANVYLNELDSFVKQKLKVKHYIRYVDDFVLFHPSPYILQDWKEQISSFLNKKLLLRLHPDKSKIIPYKKGIEFLGFKIFPNHILLKKKNMLHFQRKMMKYNRLYDKEEISYDKIYDFLEGWLAHAKHACTYKKRQKVLTQFEKKYNTEISSKEVNRYIRANFLKLSLQL